MKQCKITENPGSYTTSVFKSGENVSLKKGLTAKWVELINQMERNKGAAARR